MVPEIERQFRVLKGKDHKGLFGKSSGGYGAIVHGMKYADHWARLPVTLGYGFRFGLSVRFSQDLMHLSRYGRSVEAFMQKLQSGRKIGGDEMHTLMILAMAATYDPAPELPFGVRLPVNSQTCELDDEAWQRWLKWDPVRMIESEECQENLKQLKAVFIDCGSQDQYSLVFGARRRSRRLTSLGIAHTYDEFSDNHSSIDYRMDMSLPFLYEALGLKGYPQESMYSTSGLPPKQAPIFAPMVLKCSEAP